MNSVAEFDCEVRSVGRNTEALAHLNSTGVADMLGAMGIVVAVVTLLLTAGIAYLVEQQSKLERLIASEHASQRLDMFLEQAKSEVLEHFLSHGNPKAAALNTLKVGVLLSALRSKSVDARATANDRLLSWLGPAVKAELPNTVRYCDELREWLRLDEKTARQDDSIGFLDGKSYT